MLNGDKDVAGSLTSGGTESVLMAVKTYRDRALHSRPHLKNPNIIASQTVHPAFEKAAHYFGLEIIHVKTTDDLRMDVREVERVINSNTILIVGSAPQYCHGVIDPITKLAKIAEERGMYLWSIVRSIFFRYILICYKTYVYVCHYYIRHRNACGRVLWWVHAPMA